MYQSTQYPTASGSISTIEIGEPSTALVTLVFIHGWLDNAASFLSVFEQLAPASHIHAIAIDLPGHGLSSHKSASSYYPFHDYIDDIYQVLHKISPNKLVLVGHSLGALIASCYSAAFPEQVAGLVQIEGKGPLSESPQKSVQRMRNGVLSRQRQQRKPSRPLHSQEDAIMLRAHVNELPRETIAPIVKRGTVLKDGHWHWSHDQRLKCDSIYRMSPEHAQVINMAIQCEQLIILGDNGFDYLLNDSDTFHNVRAKLVTIPGGHHCHLEYPERVSELILGLVNKI